MLNMTQKYRLSRLAEKDLTGIWRYTLKAWSRKQANEYVSNLLKACDDIAKSPEVTGQPYEHVREGYRKYICAHHVIFYKLEDDGIPLISRVLHEKMDFDRHL